MGRYFHLSGDSSIYSQSLAQRRHHNNLTVYHFNKMGRQLIWQSASFALRRWRVRVLFGPQDKSTFQWILFFRTGLEGCEQKVSKCELSVCSAQALSRSEEEDQFGPQTNPDLYRGFYDRKKAKSFAFVLNFLVTELRSILKTNATQDIIKIVTINYITLCRLQIV